METEWFVNAKRALAIAEPICTSADALVVSTRESLESALAIHSKSVFLAREVQSQMALLYRTNEAVHNAAAGFENQFEASLAELDRSGSLLDAVLVKLESTSVDPAFRSSADNKPPQCLRDYTDDSVVEELKDQLRRAIDFFQVSYGAMSEDMSLFDTELSELSSNVSVLPPHAPGLHGYRDLVSSLELIEDHARSMATLLESLAHHYDQCSQALMTSSTTNLAGDPEREDLVEVLRDDSAQVEGVLSELQQRLVDMETLNEPIVTFLAESVDRFSTTTRVCADVAKYQSRLDGHLEAAQKFAADVSEYFDRRNTLLDELDSLVGYFDHFIHSYDALVLEVLRRKKTQNTMEQVVRVALDKLKFIYEEEMASRRTFRQRNGDYLPSDLWPGLSDPPIGYEIIAHEISPLPDLSQSLIDQVKKRLVSAPPHPK